MNISSIIEDCNPFELPSVRLVDKKLLPSIPGLYYVLYDSQVLYIGKAFSIKARWRNHPRHNYELKNIEAEVTIAWLSLEGLEHRLSTLEKCAIADFRPPLNSLHYIGAEDWVDTPLITSIDRPFKDTIACTMSRPTYCTMDERFAVNCCPINSIMDSPMNGATNKNRMLLRHLWDHYGISRTTLYNRLKALSIEPIYENKKAFVNEEQLALLDELHNFLGTEKSGKKPISDFLEMKGIASSEYDGQYDEQMDNEFPRTNMAIAPTSQLPTSLSVLQLPEELIEIMRSFLDNQTQPPDLFANHDLLAKAARENYRLSTSALLPLVSLKSVPRLDTQNRFSRMGFTFLKIGRAGRESEWVITKLHTFG